MYVNLHALPRDCSLYMVGVTSDPLGTPRESLSFDEVDVVASSRASVDDVLAAADLSAYVDCRVIGVADQSVGYVLWFDVDSTRVVECAQKRENRP